MESILVYETDSFKLYAEQSKRNDVVTIKFTSVWPKARTDRTPHTLFSINLSEEAVDKLADFLAN